MATWVYPPIPQDRLEQEADSALVRFALYRPAVVSYLVSISYSQ